MELKNEQVRNHQFLNEMYEDQFYPNNLVDSGRNILLNLCVAIESEKPKTLKCLYKLTHNATNQFNDLQEEFDKNGSEIETVARECIATDFEFIAESYGFEADIEELIETREW